jgi:hypothetical protein
MNSLHAEINDFIQRIFDEKKIKIESIEIDWIDISFHGECKFIANEIKINTVSRKKVFPIAL